MSRNKVGIWRIYEGDLKQLLHLPKSIDIDSIYSPHEHSCVFDIKLKGYHKALFDISSGQIIPILTQELMDKIWGDKVKIRELSDKVKFIRDLEEE